MKNLAETGRDPSEPAEPQVSIQSFTPEWQDSTIDCIAEVRRAQYNDPTGFVKPIYKEGTAKNFQRFPYEDFFIALDQEGQQVVGNIGLRFVKEEEDKTRIGQLRRFNVRPTFEGKGIGSRLLNRSLDFAKENNYREIYLTTECDKEHERARGMYEGQGFKRVASEEMSPDDLNLILTGDVDDNLKNIKEGKTLIYKLKLGAGEPFHEKVE